MVGCKKVVNVVNVAAKTINLAKEPLKRPVCGARRPDKLSPAIPSPPASPIRVCTPEQLRSICPPDPCVCPEPPRPPTGGERLMKVIVLLSKWLFLLGFIKWTDDLGIWGNSQSTKELTMAAQKKLAPVLKSVKDESSEGSDYGFTYNLASMWNNGVTNVFYAIGVVPSLVCCKIFAKVSTKKEEPPPPPPPEDAKTKPKQKVIFFH